MQAKLLQSAFYHGFSLTAHSPIAKAPELYGLRVLGPSSGLRAPRYAAPLRRAEWKEQLDPRCSAGRLVCPCAAKPSSVRLKHGSRASVSRSQPSLPTLSPACSPSRSRSQESDAAGLAGQPANLEPRAPAVQRSARRASSLQAPKWMSEALAQCHPSSWKRGQPPLLPTFSRATGSRASLALASPRSESPFFSDSRVS